MAMVVGGFLTKCTRSHPLRLAQQNHNDTAGQISLCCYYVHICRLSGRGVVDFVAKHLDEVLRKEIHFDKSRSVKDCLASAYIITDIQSRKGLVQA